MTSTTKNRTSASTDLALITTFAAVIAACAILPAINGVANVPFTLQMFGIFLAAAVLGATRGSLAVLLYLAVGTAGIPVFARGEAGVGVWGGPTGGYLLAFPVAALCVGLAARFVARRSPTAFVGAVSVTAALVTVAIVGPLGAAGMARAGEMSFPEAWAVAVTFFGVDIAKAVIAAMVAATVHRAFPQLIGR